MGCNCKNKPEPQPAVRVAIVEEREPTKEEVKIVDDWYNNIDTIEPINEDNEYPLIHD